MNKDIYKIINEEPSAWIKNNNLIVRELDCPNCFAPIIATIPVVILETNEKGLKCPPCHKCKIDSDIGVVKSEDKELDSALRKIIK